MLKPYILFIAALLLMVSNESATAGEASPCKQPLEFKITAGFPKGSCFCPNGQKRSYKITSGTTQLSPCTETVVTAVAKPAFCSADVDAQDMVDDGKAVRFIGNSEEAYSGSSVASAGDVNGDGYDDILIGAEEDDSNGSAAGSVYLLFGKASGWSSETELDIANLNSGVGVKFYGDRSWDQLGYSVGKTPGDFNGDGYDDILMGAKYNDGSGYDIGSAFLFWGKSGAFTHPLEVNDANFIGDGDVAVKFEGNSDDDLASYSLSSAGDFNGDGIDDIMIGAPEDGPFGNTSSGAVYIAFGKTSGWSDSEITLAYTDSYFNGINGVRIALSSGDYYWIGSSVDTAGDINGDGYDDVIIGAKYSDALDGSGDAGAAWVVFGGPGPWTGFAQNSLLLADIDGTNGFIINGTNSNDELGHSVAHIGDINGDGYADVAVGAPYADTDGYSTNGTAYIIFGKASWDSSLDLSALDGSNGFTMQGTGDGVDMGKAISTAGDVNRDGIDDFLISQPGYDTDIGYSKGASYVIFGKKSTWDATLDVDALDGSDGFRMEGHGINYADDDYIGGAASYLGDVDGDGYSDLILGGKYSAPEPYGSDENEAGVSYVLFTDKICN